MDERKPVSIDQNALLHSAVLEENEKTVKFLLKHGADPNARVRSENESLHRLSADPNPEMREIFYRCRSSTFGSSGFPLRNWSAGTSCTLNLYTGYFLNRSVSNISERYRYLYRDSNKNSTPMHVAAANGKRDILELLVGHGGDVNLEMQGEYTALSIAVLRRHLDIAEYLVGQGARVNYKGKNGKTPLHFAVKSKQIEMVELLLRSGADVNARTEHGVTALHIAVERKLQEIAELLLRSGSDVNASTKTGVTPLHCAAVKGQKEITEMILTYGADVSVIMKKGEIDVTPLLWVTENERKKISEILHKYVAKTNAGGYYSRWIKKVWRQISGKKSNSS